MNSIVIDSEDILEDFKLIAQLLGEGNLEKKFEPVVFDLSHSFIRSEVAILAFIIREINSLPNVHFTEDFRMRLRSFKNFMSSHKFREYIEKCITVILLIKNLDDIRDIREEEKVGSKILDLVFSSSNKDILVEISAITLNYYLDLLSFYQKNYFSKIDLSVITTDPIYYEVILTQEATEEELNYLKELIEKTILNKDLPYSLQLNKNCKLFIDYRTNRGITGPLISDELNNTRYLKSSTLLGYGSAYTLAYEFSYKSVINKIDEEKKKHGLDSLKNIWLSIPVPKEILDDKSNKENLVKFVKENFWLKGILLFVLMKGSETNLQYLVIS